MQINENNINVTTFPDVIKASMKVTQNDKDTNEIIIKVFDPSGTEIIYSGITSAKIVFTKPDYNVVQGDMTVRTSDLYYKMGTNEIACAGMVTAKIQLLGASNERLTVGGFKFDVLQDPVTPWSVQSTSEYGILEQILYDANSHINNTSNPHSVSKAQVGLGDADNTSDLSKPISEATQVALDNKEPTITKNTAFNADFDTTVTNVKMDGVRSLGLLGTVARADHVHPTDTSRLAVDANAVSASKLQTERTFTISGDASGNVNFDGSANVDIAVTVADDSHNHVISNIDGLQVALDAKTSLESPALTGTPTAPTAATSTSTTQIATTAFVQSALGAGGYGDMMTASYDSNADGKVNSADNADTVGGFTVGVNVPANAVFTDTVTAVNNTLTSTSTTEALSAAQGKALKDAATSHEADDVNHVSYGTATGTNILVITLNPAPTAYVDGMAVAFKNTTQNTGAVTINVNGLGAKSVLKSNGSALVSGNLKANSVYTIRYNGSNFILQGEGGEYGTVTQPQVLKDVPFGTENGIALGTMPNQGAKIITPSTVNQAIAAGYHNGSGYVAGDADLIASNIKEGINVFGVVGTLKERLIYKSSQQFATITDLQNISLLCPFIPDFFRIVVYSFLPPSTSSSRKIYFREWAVDPAYIIDPRSTASNGYYFTQEELIENSSYAVTMEIDNWGGWSSNGAGMFTNYFRFNTNGTLSNHYVTLFAIKGL